MACFLFKLFIFSSFLSVDALKLKIVHRSSVEKTSDFDVEIFRETQSGTEVAQKISAPISVGFSYEYLVEVGFGTPVKNQLLEMDTGSSLAWFQCYPTIESFPQATAIFNPVESTTYRLLPCNHPLCKGRGISCIGQHCQYQLSYMSDSSSEGMLSFEKFTSTSFASSRQSDYSVSDFVFGCGYRNTKFRFREGNRIAGIFGLGSLPYSFLSQLEPITKNRFSYCLMDPDSVQHTFLRFGDDAVINGHVQHTPILRYERPAYYLNLTDLSIGKHRFKFPRGTFDVRSDFTQGFVIDTGSMYSRMQEDAFRMLGIYLTNYFVSEGDATLDYENEFMNTYCFEYKNDEILTRLPSMTYHLQGTDLVIPAENTFIIDRARRQFCWAVAQGPETLLGSVQQRNKRFLYDGETNQLSFVNENCSQNP